MSELGPSRLLRGVRRLARRVLPHCAVLMYHRVASVETDPWELCVSPAHFAEHVDVLAELGWVRPLEDVVRGPRRGQATLALTFDDGYYDLLHAAAPALARLDMPATAFLATGVVGTGEEYWWDELERLFLHPGTLPETLCLPLGPSTSWTLGATAYTREESARHRSWRAGEPAPSPRQAVCEAVWARLLPLSAAERQPVMEALRAWAGKTGAVRPTHRILTPEEVRTLAQYENIEIGAHTRTHPSLTDLPPEQQRREVAGSRRDLAAWLEKPVAGFSYPYGHYDAETVAVVREAGFRYACTTGGGTFRRSDPYQLPRFFVPDLDGEAFARWLHSLFA